MAIARPWLANQNNPKEARREANTPGVKPKCVKQAPRSIV